MQRIFIVCAFYVDCDYLFPFLEQIPKKGKVYSVNEGNAKNWDGPTTKYAHLCPIDAFLSIWCSGVAILTYP